MIYATELVQRYRQALIYLWNMQYWAPNEFRDWDCVAEFNPLKLPLFIGLVVNRLHSHAAEPARIFGEEYKIVPHLTHSGSSIATFMVDRKLHKARVFEEIKGPFKADDLKLSIVDLFDWQALGWREFRYYLARVDHFSPDPSIVGCEALVDVSYVDVIWHPAQILGLPIQLQSHDGG